jgi:imidazole glycerol-phosphate synthase subunit HisH
VDETMTLALIDYGAGNLTSVIKGLQAVGAEVRVVDSVAGIDGHHALVIPGVGNFGVTSSLDAAWQGAIGAAIDRGVPVLGICLGLQWFFEGSDEAPGQAGLGLMPGRCFRLSGPVKVPHVGWNTLDVSERSSRLLAGLPPDSSAYFTHSYAAPVGPDTVAVTTHGVPFAAAIERGRTFGVQFHPEKSGRTGLRVLENFLAVVRGAR